MTLKKRNRTSYFTSVVVHMMTLKIESALRGLSSLYIGSAEGCAPYSISQ